MQPTTQPVQKTIVDVQFGPSPKATSAMDKNLIAVFDDGSIQAIGNYNRVVAMLAASDRQIAQLVKNKATWEQVKAICDALPDFAAILESAPTAPETAPAGETAPTE